MARTLSAATQESSINDDEDVEEEADERNVSHLDKYTRTIFGELCSGQISLSTDIQKKLKCRYVGGGSPFLRIAPFREEEVFLKPRIVVYHNVIYEEEIEVLKKLSEPKLESAKVRNQFTGKAETSKERIAKSAWLGDDESEHVKLLNRRVELITSLSVDTAERLQIAYYGMGGFYQPHSDFFPKSSLNVFEKFYVGNRIATILFYMNDVEKGGGTVFTKLNVTILPEKGSAAFWYNLKRNGKPDFSTYHGACKVLSGTKWIATKWLREIGQEFLRPCSLLENE